MINCQEMRGILGRGGGNSSKDLPLTEIFLYSHYLSALYFIDYAIRKAVVVTCGQTSDVIEGN